LTTGTGLPAFPGGYGWVERLRRASRERFRSGLVGAHLARRRGQSLEFREFAAYLPGDDVRTVDWRASARFGLTDVRRWLVRRFDAEEHVQVAVSIDLGETMAGPDALPKWVVAGWLAEALAWALLRSGHGVVLHGLHTDAPVPPVRLRGGRDARRARSSVSALLARSFGGSARRFPFGPRGRPAGAGPRRANLDALWPHLPPAAVWVAITDCYAVPKRGRELAAALRRAQDGQRWVLLVELDSWPHERAFVGEGARRILGPGLDPDGVAVEIEREDLDGAGAAIEENAAPYRRAVRGGHVRWPWPRQGRVEGGAFFRRALEADRALGPLRALLMRDP
jgi:hypothetical protein